MTSRFTIEKAVRRGNKARVALAAPAGGGKTYTALTLAVVLAKGGDVLVIDTERGSASLYADQFEFQTLKWEPPYSPTELAQVVSDVAPQFEVVVIDSLSHFWMGEGGTLDMVDAAAERARGNKFAGWKTGTPAQNDMVDAMLRCPAHVIVTMRSKMEYVQDKDEKGRTTIRRVGMAPVQRDGIEYEFTLTADLDIEHRLMVAKTRCSALADKVFRPGHAIEMGKVLSDWLDGADPEQTAAAPADRDNVAGEPVVGPAAAPGPIDWKEEAKRRGVRQADLLRRAQEFARGRSLPVPETLAEIEHVQLAADLMDWLGEE